MHFTSTSPNLQSGGSEPFELLVYLSEASADAAEAPEIDRIGDVNEWSRSGKYAPDKPYLQLLFSWVSVTLLCSLRVN